MFRSGAEIRGVQFSGNPSVDELAQEIRRKPSQSRVVKHAIRMVGRSEGYPSTIMLENLSFAGQKFSWSGVMFDRRGTSYVPRNG